MHLASHFAGTGIHRRKDPMASIEEPGATTDGFPKTVVLAVDLFFG